MNESVVEWFAKQVLEYKSPTNVNGTDYILIPVDKIDFLKEQAKAMEKEQKLMDMQEYAEFCIMCDRKQMPLLLVEDWYKHYKSE